MSLATEYLLAGSPAEVERLRLQARTWEPEAEMMLDQIGVERGWRCMDVGCGSMGIIGPLARRAGSAGLIVGVDHDPIQLEAARDYAASETFGNVDFRQGDLFASDLSDGDFDLVHARFVLAPIGREQEVLDQLTYLVRRGGIVALEEPDARTWKCNPPSSAWDCLKNAVLNMFILGGGDFSAGARLGTLLRRRAMQGVQVRNATLTLPGTHPYSRLVLQFARSLRPKILSQGLLNEAELQDAIRRCEAALDNPYCFTQTFRLVQAWGKSIE
jgi:hypothetical protein